MEGTINKVEGLLGELGTQEFVVQMVMFEKQCTRAIAEKVYEVFMENDYYTSLLQLGEAFEEVDELVLEKNDTKTYSVEILSGTIYVGEVEATSEEKAREKAYDIFYEEFREDECETEIKNIELVNK